MTSMSSVATESPRLHPLSSVADYLVLYRHPLLMLCIICWVWNLGGPLVRHCCLRCVAVNQRWARVRADALLIWPRCSTNVQYVIIMLLVVLSQCSTIGNCIIKRTVRHLLRLAQATALCVPGARWSKLALHALVWPQLKGLDRWRSCQSVLSQRI